LPAGRWIPVTTIPGHAELKQSIYSGGHKRRLDGARTPSAALEGPRARSPSSSACPGSRRFELFVERSGALSGLHPSWHVRTAYDGRPMSMVPGGLCLILGDRERLRATRSWSAQ
jgi:hypothetical protein